MYVILLLLLNALSADAKTLTVGPDDSIQAAIFIARTGDAGSGIGRNILRARPSR